MQREETPELDVEEEIHVPPPAGALRTIGELLAAVVVVAAVLAAFLIAAVVVRWIFP